MMSPVYCFRSLFLAVLYRFSAVITRCFSLLFWWCSYERVRVSAAERGHAAVFFQHYQRDQRTAASSTTRVVVLFLPVCRICTPEFQSLAPDLFSPRARTRASSSPRKSASPRKRASRAAKVVPASWTAAFAGATRERKGELICQTRITRQRMPDGKPSNFGRSAAPVWRLAQLICHAYDKQLTVLSRADSGG